MEARNFKWSFAPVLNCLNCIGIPLDLDYQSKESWMSILISLSLFFLNVKSNLVLLLMIVHYVINDGLSPIFFGPSPTATVVWNFVIDNTNYILSTFGTHLVLLAVTKVSWKSLANVLHHLERQELLLDAQDYWKFRKTCLSGLAFFIAVCTFNRI